MSFNFTKSGRLSFILPNHSSDECSDKYNFFQTMCLKLLSTLFETIPIHILSVNTVFRRFTCYCEIKCIFFFDCSAVLQLLPFHSIKTT